MQKGGDTILLDANNGIIYEPSSPLCNGPTLAFWHKKANGQIDALAFPARVSDSYHQTNYNQWGFTIEAVDDHVIISLFPNGTKGKGMFFQYLGLNTTE